MKLPWLEFRKCYQGGADRYVIYLPVALPKLAYISEEIGEATPGGHNYGYTVYTRRLAKLPKGVKRLRRIYLSEVDRRPVLYRRLRNKRKMIYD